MEYVYMEVQTMKSDAMKEGHTVSDQQNAHIVWQYPMIKKEKYIYTHSSKHVDIMKKNQGKYRTIIYSSVTRELQQSSHPMDKTDAGGTPKWPYDTK